MSGTTNGVDIWW